MHEEVLEGYRLSPQQRHLWALLRHGWNESYQTKCAVVIKGHLESEYLRTAAQGVVARHEILRTAFRCLPKTDMPVQVIRETGDICWREDDLSRLDDQESLIEELLYAPSHPFDFERGPFLHIHLIERAKDDYLMIVHLPAICADSIGLRNLIGELSRGYEAAIYGEELNGGIEQYADLAEWQNELIEAEETRAGRRYWRNRNHLAVPGPQLAFEGVPESEWAFEPRVDEMAIQPPLIAQIESFAWNSGRSLDQFLLACWHILLWRYTGQSEIEVGTAFDGRRAEEIEGALGLFAKYLPITCRLEEWLRFNELVDRIDKLLPALRVRQEYFSWEQFAEPSAYSLRPHFFPFCFEPETAPAHFLAGDLSFTIFKQYSCIDRFKIKLSLGKRSSGLAIEFHYNSRIFRSADIRSLMGHFQALLENAIANPEAKIGELEMIGGPERRRLLVEYNSTGVEWPQDKFVHELFLEQANRTPDAIAAIHEDGQLSYRELNERAAGLAHHLRGVGVGPEVLVGLFMERSLDLVVSLLGVLKAGGAYLPLDPSYPQARLSFMLEDAAIKLLLSQTHLRSRAPGVEQAVFVDALWGMLSQTPASDCQSTLSPDNLIRVGRGSESFSRQVRMIEITARQPFAADV